MKRHHPAARAVLALALLALVFPLVGAVLVGCVRVALDHLALIAVLVAVRLLADAVPGLRSLLSALIGVRLTRILIGGPR